MLKSRNAVNLFIRCFMHCQFAKFNLIFEKLTRRNFAAFVAQDDGGRTRRIPLEFPSLFY